MNELSIVLSIIGLLGTVSSITFAYLAFKRGNKKEDLNEGRTEGVLISDVGYIKSSIDRMEKTITRMEDKYNELLVRIAKVEQSAQSAHKRIDEYIKIRKEQE